MNQWPHPVKSYTVEEVKQFCVKDSHWQVFRLHLKGWPTTSKLEMLETWLKGNGHSTNSNLRATEVQVDNYLNALKRGGQLDMQLRVQR